MIDALPTNNEIVVQASDADGNPVQVGSSGHGLRGQRCSVPRHGLRHVRLGYVGGVLGKPGESDGRCQEFRTDNR